VDDVLEAHDCSQAYLCGLQLCLVRLASVSQGQGGWDVVQLPSCFHNGSNLFGSGVPFFVLQLSARQMHPTEIFVELLKCSLQIRP